MTRFHYTDLTSCQTAHGLVIVIDVVRAFTTAAFVFAQGADRILPVGEIHEALELKRCTPGALVCGERKGIPPPGFDFGNSPTQVLGLDLHGRTLVQCTSAGTQGVVRSPGASVQLTASFVVARATVRHVQALEPEHISFVVTGRSYDGGDEDLACAEYLEALLRGRSPDPSPYLQRVREAHDSRIFFDPARPEFPESDITYCTDLDRFNFSMRVSKENGHPVMRAIAP